MLTDQQKKKKQRLVRLVIAFCFLLIPVLGYVQRGGAPSAVDRLLATRLGTACADFIQQGVLGVMVAARGEGAHPVPLREVVGNRKEVPRDHPWVQSARAVGTCLGD